MVLVNSSRGGPTAMHQAPRRPLGELDPGDVAFEPGAKRTRA